MPVLKNNNSLKNIKVDFTPLENNINNLKDNIEEINKKITKLTESLFLMKEENKNIKDIIDGIISYTDKNRVAGCIKDLTTIKKQINMTKTSKLLKTLNELQKKIIAIEDSFVSDDDEETISQE